MTVFAEHVKIVDEKGRVAYFVAQSVLSTQFRNDVFAFLSNPHRGRVQFSDFVVDLQRNELTKCRYDILTLVERALSH
jgi:hypothetical protein